jgi:predicted O-methyltransferase YrrM
MPTFHEEWYHPEQLKELKKIAEDSRWPNGDFTEYSNLEIGCWEGRSSIVLANALYPEQLICVDTWKGNVNEGEPESQRIAKERDVYSQFLENMLECTRGNFFFHREDCHEFLRVSPFIYKFAHIDASHDYESVKKTIEAILPMLIVGGTLCGDDYLTACDERLDLNGGVMRAVKELLPNHYNIGNLWIWKKEK